MRLAIGLSLLLNLTFIRLEAAPDAAKLLFLAKQSGDVFSAPKGHVIAGLSFVGPTLVEGIIVPSSAAGVRNRAAYATPNVATIFIDRTGTVLPMSGYEFLISQGWEISEHYHDLYLGRSSSLEVLLSNLRLINADWGRPYGAFAFSERAGKDHYFFFNGSLARGYYAFGAVNGTAPTLSTQDRIIEFVGPTAENLYRFLRDDSRNRRTVYHDVFQANPGIYSFNGIAYRYVRIFQGINLAQGSLIKSTAIVGRDFSCRESSTSFTDSTGQRKTAVRYSCAAKVELKPGE